MKSPITVSKATLAGRVNGPDIGREARQLERLLDQLEKSVARSRGPYTPASYKGTMLFQPEQTSFTLDTDQGNAATNAVNYVVRSGQDFRIPVQCGGDGIFLCHGVRCHFWQRLYNAQTGVLAPIWMLMAAQQVQFDPTNNVFWTTKFECFPRQPEQAVHATGALQYAPMVNYAWNCADDTGWSYGDQFLPHTAMQNRSMPDPLNLKYVVDGKFHRFRAPMTMEQKRTMSFHFRALTDIVQFDSTLSGTNAAVGLPFDDRENGRRNQSVLVQAEFVGERIGGSA